MSSKERIVYFFSFSLYRPSCHHSSWFCYLLDDGFSGFLKIIILQEPPNYLLSFQGFSVLLVLFSSLLSPALSPFSIDCTA